MPLPLTGTVGQPSNVSAGDGSSLPLLQGKQSELMAAQLHGKYYTQAYRGNAYYASLAATGVASNIFSATNTPSYIGLLLWNPQGSGKNLVPIRSTQIRITAANVVVVWGHAYLANAGSFVATAAPLTAFTTISTALRGPLNQPAITGQGSSVALVGAGATITTAMTWGRSNGFGAGTENTAVVEQVMVEEFDGTLIIPPGTLFAPWAASATQTGNWVPSIIWEEVPL